MTKQTAASAASQAPHYRRLRTWLGIAFSVVLLWLAARDVSWQAFVVALRHVNLIWLVPSVLLLLVNLACRAMRWRALLTSVATVGFEDALSYTLIGYLANNVLPMRVGEVIRSALLGAKLAISKSGVFATVVVERLLDVFSLLLFVALLLPLLEMPAVVKGSVLAGEALAFLAALGLYLVARWGADFGRFVPAALPARPRAQLAALWHGFVGGLGVLTDARQLLVAMTWSLISWIAFAGSIVLVMWAVGLRYLPWYVALLVVVVTNLGSAIPSSPGFVGGYHFLAVYALALWAVPQAQALTFAILAHGLSYVLVTSLGALALWRENLAFSQLREAQSVSAGARFAGYRYNHFD